MADFLQRLNLESTLVHNQRIDRTFPRFAMELQLEAIFEKRLKHRPSHHGAARVPLRFRFNIEAGGIKPRRPTRNLKMLGPGSPTVRVQTVRELDELLHCGAIQDQPSGSPSVAVAMGAELQVAGAGPDGGDFELRARLGRLGVERERGQTRGGQYPGAM